MTRTEEEKCRCMRHAPALRRRMLGKADALARSKLMRLMANPTRLQIVSILCERDVCVCVMCAILGRSQANVSQHLSKLRDNGLVDSYQAGKLTYYRIRDGRARRIIGRMR
jgi:DNA-binding transcriptional ArsR family regulator